ncbi:nuclease-related domain-containing protein [Macrococcus lamae]|uniref:NERD domain-containing protein n=1 Tax=Macrococcus lamae TaxID=198484 RepID=A0A4R6BTA0_9STAP|nr:nuclease-related domain-containing protein [Macrococcus lamae]TDM07681.1 NERD domain-containing protein [Macrococcus lamae]
MEIVKRRGQERWQHQLMRTALNETERLDVQKQQQGLNGEKLFEELVMRYVDHGSAYFDLRLTVFDKEFQIDCLIVMQDDIYIFEVKWSNYDIVVKDGRYYFSDTMNEITSYSLQKDRTPKLINEFLKKHQLNYTWHYYHVFINPEQQVYGVQQVDHCFHYYTAISLLRQTSAVPCFYPHDHLHDILIKEHIVKSRHEKDYSIEFKDCGKGVLCECGTRFLEKCSNRLYTCHCGKHYSADKYLKLAAAELELLFPDQPLNVRHMMIWTENSVSRKTVSRFLSKSYQKIGQKKGTHYKKLMQ